MLSLFLAPAAILRGSTAGIDGEFWGSLASVGLRAARAGGCRTSRIRTRKHRAQHRRRTGDHVRLHRRHRECMPCVEAALVRLAAHDNMVLVVSDEITYYGGTRSLTAGILTCSAYVLIPLIIGLVMFKRRDVT